ncbi:winged helix DNA-binding domain-containing protein [Cellulosimicrobium marinum]|uniref:winged helix DNA-binding domain-containing protein n=1 Tax=Cellulosimicrobium marinum TaxID=1638992 RepID=UPI001E491C0F|nr:winged helix DNA-binding domain-containing protein [Cellulosimicrobium marinum]MCB7136927.1 winged helix DNA-binding domain-containing protein [Cellulosimicrobium marinum]
MRITVAQRRRRLVAHQLALAVDHPGLPAARTAEDVVDRLLALHATDAPSVYLSVLARAPGLVLDDVRDALFGRRTLVKVLAMRRTMFVVRREVVPVVHAAAGAAVGRRLRVRLLKELATLPTDPPVDDAEAFLAEAERQVHAALAEHGPLDGASLSRAAPLLRTAFLPTTDKSWDVRRTATSQLLSMLSAEGVVVRGEPRGSWSSNRHEWAPMSDWFPGGVPELDEPTARADLARAWLAVFGPATEKDLQWWTGWNLRDTRAALAALDLQDVEVETGPPDDPAPLPGVMLRGTDLPGAQDVAVDEHLALLPSLDPTTMGWTARDWYLGPHRGQVFDTIGNAGATVWWQGRIVGAWTVRRGGEPAYRLLEDVGADAEAAVAAEAARIAGLLGGDGTTASFPTPLYRELHA